MTENLVLYDWLSLTSKIHSVDDIKDLIGLRDAKWESTKGAHGYKKREYFASISIHYDGEENQGVWLEMSGQGCRAFESYSETTYEDLFAVLKQNPQDMNLTRLDVAFDDHTGILDMDELCRATLANEYLSKSKAWEVIQSWKGQSIFIGSPTSEVRIRIYDKARERGFDDGRHWIRIEIQMRDDRARMFANYCMPVGQTFAGVLLNYLRYVVPNDEDTNKARWDMQPYWLDLVQNASALSIYAKPGTEYNLANLHDHVCFRNGNAIDTYIQLVGLPQFLDDLRHGKPDNVNPKYSRLLAEYKTKHKKETDK